MHWNYRTLAHKYKEDVYLKIHEVYYDENDIPNGYSSEAVTIGGDDLKGIEWSLNKIKEGVKKPILWAGEKFPNKLKIKYTCLLCGRNNFDRKISHKCLRGYQKHKLKWEIHYQ